MGVDKQYQAKLYAAGVLTVKQFAVLFKDMDDKFGPGHLKWPRCGCGKGSVPCANGASMVLEVEVASGKFEAMASARLPTLLDDAFKKARYLSMKTFLGHITRMPIRSSGCWR